MSIILHHAIWCPGDGKVPTGGEEILFRKFPQKNMANLLKPIVLSPYITWTYTLWVTSVYLAIWDHIRHHQKGIIDDSCHVWRSWWVHSVKHMCTFPINAPKTWSLNPVQPPHLETLRTLLRKPKHGMKESETTRYVQNLKATGSEASLRLILPSPWRDRLEEQLLDARFLNHPTGMSYDLYRYSHV